MRQDRTQSHSENIHFEAIAVFGALCERDARRRHVHPVVVHVLMTHLRMVGVFVAHLMVVSVLVIHLVMVSLLVVHPTVIHSVMTRIRDTIGTR